MFDYIWPTTQAAIVAVRRKMVADRIARGEAEAVLEEAINHCDIVLFEDFLSQVGHINISGLIIRTNDGHYTLLTYALSKYTSSIYKPEYIQMITLLSNLELDFNAPALLRGYFSFTPLSYLTNTKLIGKGWTEEVRYAMIDLIIDNGANPNGQYYCRSADDGRSLYATPLTDAVQHGDLLLVKFLLSKGADPETIVNGRTALYYSRFDYYDYSDQIRRIYPPIREEIAKELIKKGGALLSEEECQKLKILPIFEGCYKKDRPVFETTIQRRMIELDIAKESLHDKEIDKSHVCSISQELMMDPVSTTLGYTYDRCNIEQWFSAGKKTNPVTGEEMANTNLVPNIAIRGQIIEFLERIAKKNKSLLNNRMAEL